MEFVTWDVSPNTDLMISIMQANLRAAFNERLAEENAKSEPQK
jgi:hypothetical protein